MSRPAGFAEWAVEHLGFAPEEVEALHIVPAFEILVSRIEAAHERGAKDPLATVAATAPSGNSRATTRTMLSSLGYTRDELRTVHRLLAGSPNGWPGMLRLYAVGPTVSQAHRDYVRHELLLLSRLLLRRHPA